VNRVEGKVAFVTGAARGQGRSHALRLAEEGADIIAVDLCKDIKTVGYPMSTPEDLKETVRQVEALGRRIVAEEVDVRDFVSLQEAVTKGVTELGRLDIVCGNAGIASSALSWEMDEVTWQDMLDVNLTGVWHTVKSAIPHLIEQGRGGSMILTSSTAALVSIPNFSHYSAAKAGVVAMAKSLVQELGPYSIRVNTVHPTSVDTMMTLNPASYELCCPDNPNAGPDDLAEAFIKFNALPVPWVDVRDISNAVLFLASEESRYVSGCTLTVDAGCTSKYPGM
jgi:(+)-trans-carveol dehydrogenase